MQVSNKMNHPYLIMFDFDGVIVDSLDVFTNAFLASCQACGYNGISTQEQFKTLLDGNFYEGLDQIGLSKQMINTILGERFSQEVQQGIHKITLFDDISRVLEHLAVRHVLIVITSNVSSMVQQFFDREKIHCFKSIMGAEVEKSKVNKIKKAIARHPDQPAYYVGDTRGDMIEGRQAGASTIAVTWGWHGKSKLKEANPDYMAHTPAELLRLFNG